MGDSTLDYQFGKHIDNVDGLGIASHPPRQTRPALFINAHQAAKLAPTSGLPSIGMTLRNFIAPDMINPSRAQPYRWTIVKPRSSPWRLLGGNPQTPSPPYSLSHRVTRSQSHTANLHAGCSALIATIKIRDLQHHVTRCRFKPLREPRCSA